MTLTAARRDSISLNGRRVNARLRLIQTAFWSAMGPKRFRGLSAIGPTWLQAVDRFPTLRTLPIVQGMEHLAFRCTGCGACCRTLRVTVTHHDLRRLARATAEPYGALVEWLGPDEVDMTGEPGSFVELREGRRLMVLAQRDAACRWLAPDGRCRVYEARPLDCQLFPFHLSAVQRGSGAGAELSLLELKGCDYARDGATDANDLSCCDAQRWRELADYQSSVARWNRLARHRRRLGHRSRQAHDFLAFLEGHSARSAS